jgi:hypothetical protein
LTEAKLPHERLPTKPVVLNDRQAHTPPAPRLITPPPELPSIRTSSAEVGTEAPPAPPDVADQWVVVAASHVPVPPTQ